MCKTIAIMQPYFLPYIGYWQLIHLADEFILYDNIKYTKKGWINRNRYLCEGQSKYFTIPIEKASDYLDVRDRKIASSFDKGKLITQIRVAYQKAPFYKPTYELFKDIVMCTERNLFKYLFSSIKKVAEHLEINTTMTISSHIDMDHSLKSGDRVLAICEKLGASRYINPIGGTELYDKEVFRTRGIEFNFLRAEAAPYKQISSTFVPFLSILDVLMFNGADKTKRFLELYNLE